MLKIFKQPKQVITRRAIRLFKMSESIFSPKKTCSHFSFQQTTARLHNIDQDREMQNEEELRLVRNGELLVVSVNLGYHTLKEGGNVRVYLLEKCPTLLTE